MRKFAVEEIVAMIEGPVEVIGDPSGKEITRVAPIDRADPETLAWLRPGHPSKLRLLTETRAGVIVVEADPEITGADLAGKVLLVVRDPKLAYLRLVKTLFEKRPAPGVHPSAVVHPEAEVSPGATIGAHATIGKAVIGDGSVIGSNVVIHDGTRIGRNVEIESGCVIGEAGYNFARDEAERLHRFPHLGGVVIEDDVEIQSLTVVDRGVLGDTVIGRGTKIDSHCYIAHNCRVGRDNAIIGHTMLSGSVTTGDACWFSPASTVRDGCRIGHRVFVGMGSVVVGDLPDGAKVMGVPARPVDEVKAMHRRLKDVSGGS